ncbi:MAG: flavin-containing monooxygenase [Gemmatimonadota bacterium]
MMTEPYDAVVIGAGPAGLASAACLRHRGVEAPVLERDSAVAPAWRSHYRRLRLHTNRRLSGLPHLPIPRDAGRYPRRDDVVAYLERYASEHAIEPRFETEVVRVCRSDGLWRVVHREGSLRTRTVVVATGFTDRPNLVRWPGDDSFPGRVLHSSEYRTGEPFAGRSVLVVGFGNSAGEIALDLVEHGAHADLSVRSPVNILPRQLLGIPILALAIPLSVLPPRLADAVSAPLLRLVVGSYDRLGLRKSRKGPLRQIEEDRRIPLIDVGTVELLRTGGAEVMGAIDRIDGATVHFSDGSTGSYDSIVAATGYRPSFDRFLECSDRVTDDTGVPRKSGRPTSLPGLYFCGFYVSPTGMLREFGIEARRIADHIAHQL